MKELYLTSSSGDLILVEVVETNGFISLIFPSSVDRVDLEVDSALDLAEELMMLSNEISYNKGQ